MYNGIGLSTARGSGTNGYVQKNRAYISSKPQFSNKHAEITRLQAPTHNAPNEEILEHQVFLFLMS